MTSSVDVVDRMISATELARLLQTSADGAMVTFEGVVRDHDGGRAVTALDYEAHPEATERLRAVAASVASDFPAVRLAALHRVGALSIGDVALAVAVAASHRQEAFAACSALVDRIKAEVPIWKRQVFADGSDEWVGSL
ncbi:molybdenum cofactor biosynthesis protein MoaE [Frondihabitans australicus]|uniref:Molybdopterin synthase subunit MoaE n=1 Tax=Frondihabitans australicus TaxID=386892 RepID=A0A495IE97_9MICO|nr:molybdenum cofactor biosynthesis protein MoaE [Frondihabitans australicus]RKR73326.1 molybdopterin synthase subunit MoaE [Frondihabitans australicus]